MAAFRHRPVWWVSIVVFSVLSGYLLVQYLIAPPLTMMTCAALGLLSFGLLIFSTSRFFTIRPIPSMLTLTAAVLVGLVGITTGYGARAYQFLSQEEHEDLPALIPMTSATTRPAEDGHSAVIYFTHGEPPGYSPTPWLETFREFDADGAPFIPVPFRPFFFSALREKYLTSGGSPHNFVHRTMMSGLENMIRAEGDTSTRFYIAFLDSEPSVSEAAIRAVNEGANKINIANVFLTQSSHTLAGEQEVNELNLGQYGLEVCISEPLWNSTALKQMFVERANKAIHAGNTASIDKSRVGILLVGHGQPEAWQKIYPTQTAQENQFRTEVIRLLVADGFKPENISLAWMEFQEPGVTEIAKEMAGRGINTLLVFSAAISAPSIHSEYDVPDEVHKANLPANIQVINLGAWGYDPLVLQAIREKLEGCTMHNRAVQ